MNACDIADDIERRLRAQADPARAEHERAYLKSDREHFGVSVPATRRTVRATVRRLAGTWALVDPLAEAVAGEIVQRSPAATTVLDRWAGDPEFWIRRSALLALLGPIRKGGGDLERFSRYADSMLVEREFFIRKAIGWVLRETGKKRPDWVAAWLAERPGRVPVLAAREAVKYLPEADRPAFIDAARSGR